MSKYACLFKKEINQFYFQIAEDQAFTAILSAQKHVFSLRPWGGVGVFHAQEIAMYIFFKNIARF